MKNLPLHSNDLRCGSSSGGAGRRRGRPTSEIRSGEDGAILILALAYLVVIGLVVAALTTWVSNDLNNSSKFSSANSLTAAASGMTDLAIQYVRYNPLISNDQPVAPAISQLVACWGGTSLKLIPMIDGEQVAVWCTTSWTPLVATTRTVTFYACPISITANGCAAPGNALLTAIVVYDDYPPAPARSAPIQDLCTVFCGEGMTIQSWQWGASSSGNVTGVAASMTFSNEPSDTNALSSTQAAVTVEDSSGNAVAGDTVSIIQQSGPSCLTGAPPAQGPCITSSSSTLTAITNTSGVAEFNNIVPQAQGNYTITAADGSATATSTNFVVGLQRSVITTSSAPVKATQGGMYTATGTASSGTVVSITAPVSDNGVCSLSGAIVTFNGPGTCTLNFNDPETGSTTYAPALQVTLSFPVGGKTVTQVGITLNKTTPTESTMTNDQVFVVLENSVGATQAASATTTVVLSDIGNGEFATTQGVAGNSTLTLTFNTGQSTATTSAYFGSQTLGPDTISAVNGTTNWGTASLNVQGGAPTQVAITPSTTTPSVNSLTNTTLTLQLEDSGGNLATSNTAITLALSAPTGFFSASIPPTAGTTTLNVIFPSGVGTETVYFGDQTSGSDTITAKNGLAVWTTTTLNLQAGAASQIVVTINPLPPAKATGFTPATNATVTAKLEDQYGNSVTTTGVSLTFTDSGTGLFSAGNVGTRLSQSFASLAVMTTNGIATASFGDTTAQSDIISVTGTVNGTAITGMTAPFTV